jgi:pSer/pThr/pTyr-binding forkhead associated (FHA) protein
MVWEGTNPSLVEYVLYDETRSRVILFSSTTTCLVGMQQKDTKRRREWEWEWVSARYRSHRVARKHRRIVLSDGSVYDVEAEDGTRGVYVNREKGVTLLRIVAPGAGSGPGPGENTPIDIDSVTFPYHRLILSGDRILLWKRGVFFVESYPLINKNKFMDAAGRLVTVWLYPEENKMVWMVAGEDYQTLRISWIPAAFGA